MRFEFLLLIIQQELYEYDNETILYETDGKSYSSYVNHRIALLGDVGSGKTTLLESFLKDKENPLVLATNGLFLFFSFPVESTIQNIVRFVILFVNVIFSVISQVNHDYSQLFAVNRIISYLVGYLRQIEGAILVVDGSITWSDQYIQIKIDKSFTHLSLHFIFLNY